MKQENVKKQEEQFMNTAKQISKWMKQPKVYVLNSKKENKVYEVQQKMQEILDEEIIAAKVEIKPCPLGMGDVVIEFECDCLTIRDIKNFQSVINEVSNFEIYPTKNGVKFAGIISGVAKAITY